MQDITKANDEYLIKHLLPKVGAYDLSKSCSLIWILSWLIIDMLGVELTTEWRYQNFDRNRYRDFFYDTKFSETETETFFRDQIFPKPKLFSETKLFQNRNRDFFSETKFFETETETLKNLAKVSRPRPKPRLLNIFWNEILKIWDLQAKLEFLGPKFGTLIVNWVKIISAR